MFFSFSPPSIPFGHPPLPETTHISETHRTNVKAMPCPAKRNLGLARAGSNGTPQTRKFRA
ncbi:MAG: hypothetical protein J6T87_00915 [Bacteroidales bacterium]|nr:hypothetical protein [Bacteroidales bacterium]